LVYQRRDQRVALFVLQATSRPVLLVMRPRKLGYHPTVALHHTRGFWGMDGPSGFRHLDLPLLAHYGDSSIMGFVFATLPSYAT
jgi:hypothetical protein